MKPLEPIRVPWKMKPLSSAETGVERLDDGRLQFSIRHEVLTGVTPAMLVWWFNNMDGTMRIGDIDVPRYRVWHPLDHVALTYIRPGRDGRKFSSGAKIRIQEIFHRNPRYQIDVIDEVSFLDETGFGHFHTIGGIVVARMDYRFTPVARGTLYENSLIVGTERPFVRTLVNRMLRPVAFAEDKGRAWLTHNVEEVGNFQFFLPDLFANAQGGQL
jgi:hypothetical protein